MKKFIINGLYYHAKSVGPIQLKLMPKQIVGISGASGCGKSLLLRALADLDENEGEVVLDGIDKNDFSADSWRKKVSLVPAESQWWFDTLAEHFDLADDDLYKNIKALGFSEDVMSWSVSRLSSGEKQRFSLLRCLQNKPEILLLDEPTANLDAGNTQLYEKFIKNYVESNHAAVIWISHDLLQIQGICDTHYQLKNGELIEC